MVAAGDRHPICCVVVTAGPRPGAPCGICRQVLAEFALDMHVELVAEDASGRAVRRTSARLAALIPHVFRLTRSGAFRRSLRDPAGGNRRA
jgi:cytidine deaminase